MLKAFLGMADLWSWGKTLVLLVCCLVVLQSEELDQAEKLVAAAAFMLLAGRVILRMLRAQQQVETENGLLLLRTAWGGEKQFFLREIGALTYTAHTLTVRDKHGKILCRLDRRRWNMDPLLEEAAAYGQRSSGPYTVGAGAAEKVLAVVWLILAAANCGLWTVLYVLSRQEEWETGALIVLILLCTVPLALAVINLRVRMVRRLLVEESFLRYVPAWGRGTRDFAWQEVFWIAQPGGRAHLLRLSDQRTAAVLSGRDAHIYELICDLYAHVKELTEQRKGEVR